MKLYVKAGADNNFNFIRGIDSHGQTQYTLENTDITITHEYIHTQITNVGFATLERYKDVPMWVVRYDEPQSHIRYTANCKLLNDAKSQAIKFYERFYT